jgi:alkanesulfonate monooxygenase SsuD/methylene tetrahydromethanopterin reductase-like flavin-dependent oxidoreductase (luciferase family)
VKFGIMQLFQHNTSVQTDPARAITEAIEQAVYAESLGFDSVWLAEHHFSPYGLIGSPLTAAAAIAARTERIRIGTAVLVLPFYNPIRLAEECALIDVLSGGRLDIGYGRGYQPREFRGFGIDPAESRQRTKEAVDVLKLAWTAERFSYDGEFNKLDDISVFPKPVQDPHPPLYQAATSIDSFRLAGEAGARILTSPNFTPLHVVKKQFDVYSTALEGAGHEIDDFRRPLMHQVYVASDDQDAFDTPRPYVEWNEALKKNLIPGADGEAPAVGYESWARIARNVKASTYEQRAAEGSMFATPDQIGERVSTLVNEIGVTELICWFNFGGMPDQVVRRSMRLFAEEIMPVFV